MTQRFLALASIAALAACGSDNQQPSHNIPEGVPQAAIIRMEVDANGYLVGEPSLRAVNQSSDEADLATAFEQGDEVASTSVDELDDTSSTQSWFWWWWSQTPQHHHCGGKWQPACKPAKAPAAPAPAPVPAKETKVVVTQKPTQTPAQLPTQTPAQLPTQTPTQLPKQEPAQLPKQEPVKQVKVEPVQKPKQEPALKPQPKTEVVAVKEEKKPTTPAQVPAPKAEPVKPAPAKPVEKPAVVEQKPAVAVAKPSQQPTQLPAQQPTQLPAQQPTQLPAQQPTQTPTQASAAQTSYQQPVCTYYYHSVYGYVPCYKSHTYWYTTYSPSFNSFGQQYGYLYSHFLRHGRYVYYYYTTPTSR